MPPFIRDNGDSRRGEYNCMHLVQRPRRSLVQVNLPESKRKVIVQRKTLSEQLEARRRVKFSIVKTALLQDVPLASQMTEEEKSLCWWSKEQLGSFECSSLKILESIPRTPKIGRTEDSYLAVLQRVLDVCYGSEKGKNKSVTPSDMKLLSEWHRSTLSKRGLETRLLDIKEHNDSVRENLVYSIKVLRRNDRIGDHAKHECIRACSERMTLSSRSFAKILADADRLCTEPKPITRRSSSFLLG
mmetsp:Transcript_39714/g.61048  ORF Transcript_39714/g.61048 Transcript_39714/m.61048 type:complete len:244 (-) Transcript_39714:82-813(-)